MSITYSVILQRLISWLARKTYERAKRREEKRKEASKIAIKLGVVLLFCTMIQGCATWDRSVIFAYELIHGVPDKPMNTEVK